MGESTWEKLPALEQDDIYIGCLCCSTACQVAHMDMIVAVGFGYAGVTKDGETVWSEDDSDDFKTVEYFERMAAADPDHDWRIVKHGPMHGETFQRQGENYWVCVESNQGFA